MSRRLDVATVALVLVLLVTFLALDLLGLHAFVVAGGSMEPAIPRGSLVLVRPALPAAVALSDVVTFQHKGRTVTHRVDAIEDQAVARAFRTNGDANPAADPDPVVFDDQVGLHVAQFPLAGYVLGLLQAHGRLISLGLALLITVRLLKRRAPRPFPFPVRA